MKQSPRLMRDARVVDCQVVVLYSQRVMTIQQIKKEVAEWSFEKQAELVAYLLRLRNQRDPAMSAACPNGLET